MKRRLELEFRECLKCPYCRLTKRIEDSRGDIWMCYHDPVIAREIIEDKALREFGEQYSTRFPSWCPLPEVHDDEAVHEPEEMERDGRKYKWQLREPGYFDLSRAVIYLSDNGRSWRLFATRASTSRATDASYEDYPSFEATVARFEQDHGSGAEWLRLPLKVKHKG